MKKNMLLPRTAVDISNTSLLRYKITFRNILLIGESRPGGAPAPGENSS